MSKINKIKDKLKDQDYVEAVKKEYQENIRSIKFKIVHQGQPENYVRERYTGRGNRFYNAKEGIMKQMKADLKALVPGDIKIELEKLVSNTDAEYYVYIDADYYLKIPAGDSIKTSVLKENRVILPAIRPDLDNYDKLLIDVLHDIVYDDDKRLVRIYADKYYSLDPRTEIDIRIDIIKE